MKNKKVLIANRGEIAVRIIHALKELDMKTVAVYSEADKGALFTRIADECICIGASESIDSYLDPYRILSAALLKKVDSIHLGIGFLSEDDNFSELCKKCGIKLIAPDSSIIKIMGKKDQAKRIAAECNLPIIPGSIKPVKNLQECKEVIRKIGIPVVLKASYGGGGKAIRIIKNSDEIDSGYELCRKEAEVAFGNSDIIVEKYLENTRHIEVQIIGDKFGKIIHLGDRECTLQRRNQKMVEEARSENISDKLRKQLYAEAIALAKHIGYIGPGTVEFLVLPDEKHYFLEMNTRLQVEHTITELITGIDIVKQQILVFDDQPITIQQENITFNQYALECRVLAENVEKNFQPCVGKISKLSLPGGFGIRVDSGYRSGDYVTPYYDSLLLKLSCLAKDKTSAIKKMNLGLQELEIEGINTNIDFLKDIINDKRFLSGNYDEKFIELKMNNKY